MNHMSEENLFEMIKLLEGQVKHLTQLVHFQHAEIRALRIYAVAKISDSLKREALSDRKKEWTEIQRITRELYDTHISELAAISPTIANEVDVRDTMPQQERDLWYLLEKYYPPKDGGQKP